MSKANESALQLPDQEALNRMSLKSPVRNRAKLNSSTVFDVYLRGGTAYAMAAQVNLNAAIVRLSASVEGSGVKAAIAGAGVELVKKAVSGKALNVVQLLYAFNPEKEWLDPYLPLITMFRQCCRKVVSFDSLLGDLLSIRDLVMFPDNTRILINLLHR